MLHEDWGILSNGEVTGSLFLMALTSSCRGRTTLMPDELERLRKLETENAVLEQRVQELDKKIDSVFTGIARALWVVAGTAIASFVSWIIGGGMNVK